MNKKCAGCYQLKPLNEFSPDRRTKNRMKDCCDKCIREKSKMRSKKHYHNNRREIIKKNGEYQKTNRSISNAACRKHYISLKNECFSVLGDRCSICGCNQTECLQFDHKRDNGTQERRILKPAQVFRRIIENPDEYQVLCANCNWLKRESWKTRTELVTELRNQAIAKFGSVCSQCSETNREVLQFDHINNDGVNGVNYGVASARYKKYIKEDVDLQLLCCNCHQIKSINQLRI